MSDKNERQAVGPASRNAARMRHLARARRPWPATSGLPPSGGPRLFRPVEKPVPMDGAADCVGPVVICAVHATGAGAAA